MTPQRLKTFRRIILLSFTLKIETTYYSKIMVLTYQYTVLIHKIRNSNPQCYGYLKSRTEVSVSIGCSLTISGIELVRVILMSTLVTFCSIHHVALHHREARCSAVVKALCYKPGGRGFDTRWGEFLNLSNPSGRPGVYSASNKWVPET
jgi:hypothetical protein